MESICIFNITRLLSRENDSSGFTLMELLISITVVMIVMAVVAGTFRLCFKAVEKGEEFIDEQRSLIMAVNYIYSQLEAASLDEHAPFYGTTDKLRFFSKQMDPMEEEVLQDIEFRLVDSPDDSSKKIMISVQNVVFASETGLNDQVLLSGITAFEISYLRIVKQKQVWEDKWEEESGFPRAVRILFTYHHKPVAVFVRMMRQTKGLKNA
ncbi:prepilin-type N-terminal cleavage/methylation domain-containing protein [uncultured Desulfobacter sp.]|uniref:prepilin-type N-terminal cleavage/methylation domain-containing protein n=1 Tax=uncultured Desulfobacter sp. TaxID=240139 RepID=UPI002AAB0FCB|nr:prepilin-type N-terminal cleavage/methylation domain-containing protein [uncultured Desulfobacter sp.]